MATMRDDAAVLLLPPKSHGEDSLPPIVPSIGVAESRRNIHGENKLETGEPRAKEASPHEASKSESELLRDSNHSPAATQSNSSRRDMSLSTQSNGDVPEGKKSYIPPTLKIGNRVITTSKPPRQWAWKPFSSSARHDNATFYHWVRAAVEYADYPYARFDIHLDPLTYTNEEYRLYLAMPSEDDIKEIIRSSDGVGGHKTDQLATGDGGLRDEGPSKTSSLTGEDISSTKNHYDSSCRESTIHSQDVINNKVIPWTKEETDTLMELCRTFDLRWPVIIDRWHSRFCGNCKTTTSSLRRVEDLQHRYYQIGSILARKRMEAVMAAQVATLSGAGTSVTSASNVTASSVSGARPMASSVTDAISSAIAAAPGSNLATVNRAAGDPASFPSQTSSMTQTQADSHISSAATLQAPLDSAEIEALKTTHQLASLHPSFIPPISLPGSGTAHRSKMFDLAAERARRRQLEYVWNRPKEEEREEEELRAELRAVEAQLRKLKKMGKHLVPSGSPAAAAPNPGSNATLNGNETRSATATDLTGTSVDVSPAVDVLEKTKESKHSLTATLPSVPSTHSRQAHTTTNPNAITSLDPYFYTNPDDFLEASFHATAPQPTPGTPYLQSGRLFPPAVGGQVGLNKSTLKQMDAILKELSVPQPPIATKRCCDLYDEVRKDALKLLTLQKMVTRKEAEVVTKKAKLIKLKGNLDGKDEADTPTREGESGTKNKREEDLRGTAAVSFHSGPGLDTGGVQSTKSGSTVMGEESEKSASLKKAMDSSSSLAMDSRMSLPPLSGSSANKKSSCLVGGGSGSKSTKGSSKRPSDEIGIKSGPVTQMWPGSVGVIVGGEGMTISAGKRAPASGRTGPSSSGIVTSGVGRGGGARKKSRSKSSNVTSPPISTPIGVGAPPNVGYIQGGDVKVGNKNFMPKDALPVTGMPIASSMKPIPGAVASTDLNSHIAHTPGLASTVPPSVSVGKPEIANVTKRTGPPMSGGGTMHMAAVSPPGSMPMSSLSHMTNSNASTSNAPAPNPPTKPGANIPPLSVAASAPPPYHVPQTAIPPSISKWVGKTMRPPVLSSPQGIMGTKTGASADVMDDALHASTAMQSPGKPTSKKRSRKTL